jgi:hypothetical protein
VYPLSCSLPERPASFPLSLLNGRGRWPGSLSGPSGLVFRQTLTRSQISDFISQILWTLTLFREPLSGGARLGALPHAAGDPTPGVLFPPPLTDGKGAPASFAAIGPCVSAVNEVERLAQRVAHMFDGPFKRAWNGPSLWAKRTRGTTAANKAQV